LETSLGNIARFPLLPQKTPTKSLDFIQQALGTPNRWEQEGDTNNLICEIILKLLETIPFPTVARA
jgi:hypothetical protein